MATLLADLEATDGDNPTVPHVHTLPPTLWEREIGRMWLYATLEMLRQKHPPEPQTH